MSDNAPANKRELLKTLLSIAPAALLFSGFTATAAALFDWDVSINIWILGALWMIPLWFFVEQTEEGETVSDRVGTLWMCIGGGFVGTLLSLVVLGILLQQTLGLDITEHRNAIYLYIAVWVGWIIGMYFYVKHSEEKRIQQGLEMLRRKENIFLYPKLAARWAVEKESDERADATEKIGHRLTDAEWETVKDFRAKQKELFEKDSKEHVSSRSVLDSFKWSDERRKQDEAAYKDFLTGLR